MRTRHRITQTLLRLDNKEFKITFQPDGLHIREKFAREEKLITLESLISKSPTGAIAHTDYHQGSTSHTLDLAICDLRLIADWLHEKQAIDKEAIASVKLSVLNALKIVRSLETLS